MYLTMNYLHLYKLVWKLESSTNQVNKLFYVQSTNQRPTSHNLSRGDSVVHTRLRNGHTPSTHSFLFLWWYSCVFNYTVSTMDSSQRCHQFKQEFTTIIRLLLGLVQWFKNELKYFINARIPVSLYLFTVFSSLTWLSPGKLFWNRYYKRYKNTRYKTNYIKKLVDTQALINWNVAFQINKINTCMFSIVINIRKYCSSLSMWQSGMWISFLSNLWAP